MKSIFRNKNIHVAIFGLVGLMTQALIVTSISASTRQTVDLGKSFKKKVTFDLPDTWTFFQDTMGMPLSIASPIETFGTGDDKRDRRTIVQVIPMPKDHVAEKMKPGTLSEKELSESKVVFQDMKKKYFEKKYITKFAFGKFEQVKSGTNPYIVAETSFCMTDGDCINEVNYYGWFSGHFVQFKGLIPRKLSGSDTLDKDDKSVIATKDQIQKLVNTFEVKL